MMISLFLFIFIQGSAAASPNCGGVKGVECENGYECIIPRSLHQSDPTGVCKPIDRKALKNCLKERKLKLVCRTEALCKRQKELIGELSQLVSIKIDSKLKSEGLDPGLVWYFPAQQPYLFVAEEAGLKEAARSGMRDLAGLKELAGCSTE